MCHILVGGRGCGACPGSRPVVDPLQDAATLPRSGPAVERRQSDRPTGGVLDTARELPPRHGEVGSRRPPGGSSDHSNPVSPHPFRHKASPPPRPRGGIRTPIGILPPRRLRPPSRIEPHMGPSRFGSSPRACARTATAIVQPNRSSASGIAAQLSSEKKSSSIRLNSIARVKRTPTLCSIIRSASFSPSIRITR